MANEIYDSSWFGNTIDTASSIGTSTEMIQGQFNLTKLGDELVTNGDFATDSDWIKGVGWSINSGESSCDGTQTGNTNLYQSITFETGKIYQVSFNVSNYSTGTIKIVFGDTGGTLKSSNGSYIEEFTFVSGSNFYLQGNSSFIGSIDNVSVKEVRATTVEAKKCLADAIHKIGIQNIQN